MMETKRDVDHYKSFGANMSIRPQSVTANNLGSTAQFGRSTLGTQRLGTATNPFSATQTITQQHQDHKFDPHFDFSSTKSKWFNQDIKTTPEFASLSTGFQMAVTQNKVGFPIIICLARIQKSTSCRISRISSGAEVSKFLWKELQRVRH